MPPNHGTRAGLSRASGALRFLCPHCRCPAVAPWVPVPAEWPPVSGLLTLPVPPVPRAPPGFPPWGVGSGRRASRIGSLPGHRRSARNGASGTPPGPSDPAEGDFEAAEELSVASPPHATDATASVIRNGYRMAWGFIGLLFLLGRVLAATADRNSKFRLNWSLWSPLYCLPGKHPPRKTGQSARCYSPTDSQARHVPGGAGQFVQGIWEEPIRVSSCMRHPVSPGARWVARIPLPRCAPSHDTHRRAAPNMVAPPRPCRNV